MRPSLLTGLADETISLSVGTALVECLPFATATKLLARQSNLIYAIVRSSRGRSQESFPGCTLETGADDSASQEYVQKSGSFVQVRFVASREDHVERVYLEAYVCPPDGGLQRARQKHRRHQPSTSNLQRFGVGRRNETIIDLEAQRLPAARVGGRSADAVANCQRASTRARHLKKEGKGADPD
jgi:hypothetical protein